jgi:hypothetical protein
LVKVSLLHPLLEILKPVLNRLLDLFRHHIDSAVQFLEQANVVLLPIRLGDDPVKRKIVVKGIVEIPNVFRAKGIFTTVLNFLVALNLPMNEHLQPLNEGRDIISIICSWQFSLELLVKLLALLHVGNGEGVNVDGQLNATQLLIIVKVD